MSRVGGFMDFSGKTIVLTGATGGIGQAIAAQLAAKGCKLLLVARNEDKLSALCDTFDGRHEWISADVTTTKGRGEIIHMAKLMGAELLINNAGISQFDAIENITEADFRRAMEINLMAPVCLTREFCIR
jgi:short-subunit dehydrogenase